MTFYKRHASNHGYATGACTDAAVIEGAIQGA